MQNFTFGRKGTNWFLFAFVLLIGTLPSFGQEDCPEAGDFPATQDFCYLQTVADLETNGFPVYQTQNNQNDTQPIPGDELLVDGITYYVGGESGECDRENTGITVTVKSAPRPSNDVTGNRANGFEITTCTPADFNGDDLAELFNPDTGFTIEVYDSEFGTTPFTDELQAGGSYFVAQVPTDASECPSLRVAVGFNPNQIEAPETETAQTFCEDATVADLEAEGTYDDTQAIRWYRSQNGNSPLAANTQLIDGQTYYAGQVVNERGSPLPPCETPAEDRAAVTVTLNEPTVINTVTAQVCVDDIMENPDADDFEGFFLNLIGNPGAGTFDPIPADLVAQYETNPIDTFTTTYTIDGECEAITASVTVLDTETANAGTFDPITLDCEAETFYDLTQLSNNDPNYTEGGTFSGEGVENNQFDTSSAAGEYTITYTVDDSIECVEGEDFTEFTITLTGEPQEFEPILVNLCEDEVQDDPSTFEVNAYLRNLISSRTNLDDDAGEFNPRPAAIRQQFEDQNGLGNFSTTYTVPTDCGEATVDIEIEISELLPANAGNFDNLTIACDAPESIVLSDLDNLDDDANLDGTFTGEGVENNQFNPAEVGPGTYTITYNVDDSAFCVVAGTSDSATFNIIVEEASSSEVSRTLCVSEAEELLANPVQAIALFNELLEEQGDDIPSDGEFTPDLQSVIGDISAYLDNPTDEETFNTVYTYGDEDCPSSIEIALTIQEDQEANAGSFNDVTIFCDSEQTIDLTTLENLDPEASTGGTFSGVGVENNQFNASGLEADTYTITYSVDDSASCVIAGTSSSTTFDITVESEVENIAPINVTLCEDEVQDDPSTFEVNAYLRNLVRARTNLNEDEGEFNPRPAAIRQQLEDQNGLGNFNTTYTVPTDCGEATVDIEIEISELQPANAGSFDEISLECGSQDIIDLTSLINNDENATTEGTFTGEGVTDNQFDPSDLEAGTYTITYFVDDSAFCVIEGTDDETSFDITIENTGSTTEVSRTICISEAEAFIGDPSLAIAYFEEILEEENNGEIPEGDFDEDITQVGLAILAYVTNPTTPEATFTVDYIYGSEDCQSIYELAVTIEDRSEAEAGDFDSFALACGTTEPFDLETLINNNENATPGGTFSGTGVTNNQFDPSGLEADTYTITYAVDDSAFCVIEGSDDETTFEITIETESGELEPIYVSLCEDEVAENPTATQIRTFFTNLVSNNTSLDTGGTFDPRPDEILDQFENQNGLGVFETEYTVGTGDCGVVSLMLTAEVTPIQQAEAGEFSPLTFCSTDEDQDLNDFLSDDATMGGTFSINGQVLENGIFTISTMDADTYEVTYSVDDSIECVEGEDSTTFEIELLQGFNVGNDRSVEVCINEVVEDPTVADIKNYFRNLLQGNYTSEGTFEPSIEEIRASFQQNPINTFTTIFSVGDGKCSDSAELSVTVVATEEANTGEIEDLSICSTEEDIDLYTLISEEANKNGYFEGYEDGIFSTSMMDAGSYEITYTVDSTTACVEGEASTTFTITVEQGANAGEDMAVTVCSNDGQQDLYSLISADADMDGEFTLDGEIVADGIMDPAAFEAGTYEVVYTVTAGEDDECGGDDMSTITITLGEAPDAPTTGEAIAFCAIDGETAARLEADGTNLTWYSDADLTMMVSEEDLLVDGDYYVTQSSDEGCESEAAVLTVNIVDSPAPTISSNYELCEFDNPTLAALTAEINENGEVTWYDSADSMTALSNNATLTDGTTYYATLISDNGCESSERLAVTVTLDECPLLFPEAITPNGDTRNDRFVIENIESEYPNYNITIFNRWGNAVYKGNASTPTWDGTSNQSGSLGDDVLPVGVYFYVVDFNDGSTEPRQGKVYLNR